MADYLVHRSPPHNRRGFHEGELEACFPEASVMLAFAMHLIRQGAKAVEIHPDGMHAKTHDIRAALESLGFICESAEPSTCAGRYVRRGRSITVSMRAGRGDVVATVRGRHVIAECKGGIINTRHPGQRSKLRKGLCEAVGQLIGREQQRGEWHLAVVPDTPQTRTLARRMAARAQRAGIEIAVIRSDGRVHYVSHREHENGDV